MVDKPKDYKYKPLENLDQSEESLMLRPLKLFSRLILCFTHRYAAYALLPSLLLLNYDFVYKFHLQYPLIVIAFLLFLGLLYSLQDRLLYHPRVPENSRFYVPFPYMLEFEVIDIKTSDGEKLRGFFIKCFDGDSKTAPTVIYFHGNAGNCGSPASHKLATSCGANIITVDYRGYGKSSGYPSEEGLYLDGVACVEYAMSREDIDPNKIILFGHSLGGAVAIHVASMADKLDLRIAALIVENTFTTLPQVAGHLFHDIAPGLSKLPLSCYSNKFLSIHKIHSLRMPVLFIYGERDQIVDPNMTIALFHACNSLHKILVGVRKGTHNDTCFVSDDYYRAVSTFFLKVFNEDIEDGHESKASKWNIDVKWNTQIVAK